MRAAIICLGVLWATLSWADEKALQMQSACEAEPITLSVWIDVLEGLKGDILYMDYGRAEERGAQALATLSCLSDMVSSEALGRFFFLRGLAAARPGSSARSPASSSSLCT